MPAWDAMPKVEQAEKITELEYRAAPVQRLCVGWFVEAEEEL